MAWDRRAQTVQHGLVGYDDALWRSRGAGRKLDKGFAGRPTSHRERGDRPGAIPGIHVPRLREVRFSITRHRRTRFRGSVIDDGHVEQPVLAHDHGTVCAGEQRVTAFVDQDRGPGIMSESVRTLSTSTGPATASAWTRPYGTKTSRRFSTKVIPFFVSSALSRSTSLMVRIVFIGTSFGCRRHAGAGRTGPHGVTRRMCLKG
ncbi:hypothetical protein HMPREF2849_10690 [Corynebacterium sp. HMSC073B01]|nr:hypothetical protein HMPREF2849_10690 [Corynebacterium sp. HMSC073B01]